MDFRKASLMKCRIYQVFNSDLEFFQQPHSYFKQSGRKTPPAEQYHLAFKGTVSFVGLEDLYEKFRQYQPRHHNNKSYSMMASDILEIRGIYGSQFFYCDDCGLTPVSFDPAGIHKE